jgi:hypothetical protein
MRTLVPQPADEVETFVGGDTTADDEKDAFLLQVELAVFLFRSR